MTTEKIQQIARLYALQNAIQFNGKANPKAVVGKVIAALKDTGISPKDIVPVVKFDDKIISDGKPGKLTKALAQEFLKFTTA